VAVGLVELVCKAAFALRAVALRLCVKGVGNTVENPVFNGLSMPFSMNGNLQRVR